MYICYHNKGSNVSKNSTFFALRQFYSYFHDRSQYVSVNGTLSKPHKPKEGVPQGSVIGPLSFTMNTSPWENIIHEHGLGRMIYADDTQVYIVIDDESDRALLIPKIERCVDDIKRWSTANDLKLNGDKTEVLHITSRFRNASPFTTMCANLQFMNNTCGKCSQSWSNSSK